MDQDLRTLIRLAEGGHRAAAAFRWKLERKTQKVDVGVPIGEPESKLHVGIAERSPELAEQVAAGTGTQLHHEVSEAG